MLKGRLLKRISLTSLTRGSGISINSAPSVKAFSSLSEIEQRSRTLIEKASQITIVEDEDRKFNDFLQKLWKIYETENTRHINSEKRDKEFIQASLTSKQPLKDTLRIYEQYQREGFDDEHLAASIAQVAKVFRIFAEKPHYYHDLSRSKFQEDWRFQDMIGDVNFAAFKGVELNYDNFAKIIESLASIQYKDTKLHNNLIEKVKRLLIKSDDGFEVNEKDLQSNPQYGKRGYYDKSRYSLDELFQSAESSNYLQKIFTSEQEIVSEHKSNQTDDFSSLLDRITGLVGSQSTQYEDLAKAVLAAREQYHKLTQSQKEDFILKNKLLNNELLEVEENLIEAGLITPQDILNPKNLTDPKLKIDNAAKILKTLLIERENFDSQHFLKYTQTFGEEKPQEKSSAPNVSVDSFRNTFSVLNFSRCVAEISRLANTPNFDPKKEVTINDKWNELLPNLKLVNYNINKFVSHDPRTSFLTLNFTEIWQSTHEFLISTYITATKELNQEKNKETILESSSNLAYAYSIQNLSRPVKFFLGKAAENLNTLPNLSLTGFLRLLHSLNYVTGIEKTAFIQPILKFIANYKGDLNFDDNLKILHFLAVHGLNNTNQFTSLLQNLNKYYIDNVLTEITEEQREILGDLDILLSVSAKANKDLNASLSENLQFVVRTSNESFSKRFEGANIVDPLHSILKQALLSTFANKSSNILPPAVSGLPEHLKPAIFIPGDVKKLGLFITSGSALSVDENALSALHQFRFNLLQKVDPTLQCKAINYHQVFNINYKDATVDFRSDEIFRDILRDISNNNSEISELNQISLRLVQDLESLNVSLENESSLKASTAFKQYQLKKNYEVLISQLYEFFSLKREQDAIYELHQKSRYSDRLKFQLAKLSHTYTSLPEGFRGQVDTLSKEIAKKDFNGLLNGIKKSLTIDSLDLKNQELKVQSWFGTQYGEQPVVKATADKKNLNLEIINHNFIFDADYHQYRDWKKSAEKNLTFSNLLFSEEENTFNANGERKVARGLIPNTKSTRNFLKPQSFSWNWELFAYEFPQEYKIKAIVDEAKASQVQHYLEPRFKAIVNLQNLKFELKAHKNSNEIVNSILNLQFVDDLAAEHLAGKETTPQGFLCERESLEYFRYLEKLSVAPIIKDKYANFMFGVGTYKLKGRELRHDYDQKEKALYQQYLDGKIKAKEYEDSKSILKNELIEKLHGLSSSVLDKDEIINDYGRVFDFEFDADSLVKPKDAANVYNHKADPDFTRSEGDLDAMLDIKRRKAETKLIKLRILKKLHEGLDLSNNEKNYLKAWAKAINSSNLLENDLILVPKRYSAKSLRDISENDKSYFNSLDFTNFESINGLSLNDLVLELSHFFDDSIIQRVESVIKGHQIAKEWDIASNFKFDTQENKEIRLVQDEIENYIWTRSGKFNEEEISSIKAIFSTMRGFSQVDKQWLPIDQQSLNEFIASINTFENRAKYLEEWFEQKEAELQQRNKSVPHPQFLKPDSFYTDIYQQKLQDTIKKTVELVFGKTYDQITREDLHIFSENLIERSYLLKKYVPKKLAFLVKGVVNHPNFALLDRNNLLTVLKACKINLSLTNSPLTALHDFNLEGEKVPEESAFSTENIRKRLAEARTPFVEDLAKKIRNSL